MSNFAVNSLISALKLEAMNAINKGTLIVMELRGGLKKVTIEPMYVLRADDMMIERRLQKVLDPEDVVEVEEMLKKSQVEAKKLVDQMIKKFPNMSPEALLKGLKSGKIDLKSTKEPVEDPEPLVDDIEFNELDSESEA